jgi:hypothetical protein
MKGDASVCCTSCFWINVRRTATSPSPFSMKCETHIIWARLTYEEKGDAHNRGASLIRSPCPKILGLALSLLPHLERATASTLASERAANSSLTQSMPPSTSGTSPVVVEPGARCRRRQARRRCPCPRACRHRP